MFLAIAVDNLASAQELTAAEEIAEEQNEQVIFCITNMSMQNNRIRLYPKIQVHIWQWVGIQGIKHSIVIFLVYHVFVLQFKHK